MNNTEKCAAHDECFKRLYERLESVLEKLDILKDGLHGWREGVNVRFVQLEMRLARCEEAQRASASGRADVGRKVTGMLVDLAKIAIIGIAGAAAWAVAHGYGG